MKRFRKWKGKADLWVTRILGNADRRVGQDSECTDTEVCEVRLKRNLSDSWAKAKISPL